MAIGSDYVVTWEFPLLAWNPFTGLESIYWVGTSLPRHSEICPVHIEMYTGYNSVCQGARA